MTSEREPVVFPSTASGSAEERMLGAELVSEMVARKDRAGWENLDSGVSGVTACRRPKWQPNRRADEQTTAPEPHPGIQGEGGTGRRQGRADADGIGAAI